MRLRVHPDTPEAEQQRRRLAGFLADNGVDPADVPLTSTVTVGPFTIGYRAYVRDPETGAKKANRRGTDLLTVRRRAWKRIPWHEPA